VRIIVALLLVPLAAQPGGATDRHRVARVYIYTAESPSGVVSDEEQGRRDSLRDLRDAMRRKSGIVLVDDRDHAQVVVEVIGREKREGPQGGFGGKSVTEFGETILRLHVKAAEAEAEIKGIAQAYWSRAAKDAAERLTKWIRREILSDKTTRTRDKRRGTRDPGQGTRDERRGTRDVSSLG